MPQDPKLGRGCDGRGRGGRVRGGRGRGGAGGEMPTVNSAGDAAARAAGDASADAVWDAVTGRKRYAPAATVRACPAPAASGWSLPVRDAIVLSRRSKAGTAMATPQHRRGRGFRVARNGATRSGGAGGASGTAGRRASRAVAALIAHNLQRLKQSDIGSDDCFRSLSHAYRVS